MSKGLQKKQRRVAKMDRRPSDVGEVRVFEDPISIGPDRSVHIDMTKLSAPTNIYDADFAWIDHRVGSLSVFFGKRSIGKKGQLRTRLEVRYPPENMVNHFCKNARSFSERLGAYVALWPQDDTRQELTPEKWKADRDHSEWANFEAMAHSGSEAVIDFYQLPTTGVAHFTKGHGSAGLMAIPIVRVQMTSFELTRLLSTAFRLAAQIETYLPNREDAAKAAREG